jgi:thiamine biosynthesis protein ThiI
LGSITEFDSVIVRFGGEIGIKSEWTRRTYEKLLLKNIKNTLKHHKIAYNESVRKRGRIYIKTNKANEVASALKRVFGISSVSPAIETTASMSDITQTAVNVAKDTIESQSSFAIRCHRVGEHSYSSMDVCKEVGKQVLTSLKDRNLKVKLNNPQFTINIEIRDSKAYVFPENVQGPGGFPLGSQAKVICLLSGGIDSPVACWLAMKRGCPAVPVYLDNTPYTDEATTAKALDVAKKLFEWSIGFPRKAYVVPNGKNLETFVKEAPRKLTCILCKRMMYRIAERIAEMEKAEGIVTGEAIGEQASQTMHNLRVLDEAPAKYPIHRPLLGFDKTETEAIARKIGTFEISIRKAKGCNAAPNKPSTKARLEIVKEAEEKLDIEHMIEESLKKAQIVAV